MIYNNLEVKCPSCNDKMKLVDFNSHTRKCNLPKCRNYEICKENIADAKDIYCQSSCELFVRIKNMQFNKEMLMVIREHTAKFKQVQPYQHKQLAEPHNNNMIIENNNNNIFNFKWDKTKMGKGITISNNDMTVSLKEGHYVFRSVISNKPMTAGEHYWEIVASDFTENELKIGVVLKKEFNLDSAFCDYPFGVAFYGLG